MNGNFCIAKSCSVKHVIGCEFDVMLPLCICNAVKYVIIRFIFVSQQRGRWNFNVWLSVIIIKYLSVKLLIEH